MSNQRPIGSTLRKGKKGNKKSNDKLNLLMAPDEMAARSCVDSELYGGQYCDLGSGGGGGGVYPEPVYYPPAPTYTLTPSPTPVSPIDFPTDDIIMQPVSPDYGPHVLPMEIATQPPQTVFPVSPTILPPVTLDPTGPLVSPIQTTPDMYTLPQVIDYGPPVLPVEVIQQPAQTQPPVESIPTVVSPVVLTPEYVDEVSADTPPVLVTNQTPSIEAQNPIVSEVTDIADTMTKPNVVPYPVFVAGGGGSGVRSGSGSGGGGGSAAQLLPGKKINLFWLIVAGLGTAGLIVYNKQQQ